MMDRPSNPDLLRSQMGYIMGYIICGICPAKFQWCDGWTSNDGQTEQPRPSPFPNGVYT
jgi:hypothetical protein